MDLKFKTTKDIKVSKKIIEQVIGQERAVNVMKKAAVQRRHVLLIGEPGTGKSMLGLALAELLPKEKLVDIIAFNNPNDENQPLIRTVSGGKGRELVMKSKMNSMNMFKNQNLILFILAIVILIVPFYFWRTGEISDIIYAASMATGMISVFGLIFIMNFSKKMENKAMIPKLIVDNFNKKQAPFFDATGAHAGALLGDVLHDPFQSHYPDNCLHCPDTSSKVVCDSFAQKLNKYWHMPHIHKETKEEKNYEAVFLPKNELHVLGSNNNGVAPVEVLSSNRYDHDGEMIKITTNQNKELIVTKEHKIAIQKNGKTQYVEACKLKKNDEIFSLNENVIIDEQDIINTYNVRQQEQCRLYYNYLNIKSKNPNWGYKRIAKAMDQKIGKTRWWHDGKHIPIPIQTVQWLKERKLLPLTYDNPKLPLIAKMLGATFGDGGIFEKLNGIFLSSKELSNVEEFGSDLENVFNLEKGINSRIIEGGEYGHSWCYQNANRNIIRFFLALGTPHGNKTKCELIIPIWLKGKESIENEFYASLFGGEMGIPKFHISQKNLNTFDFAVTGTDEYDNNRINFLKDIAKFLDNKNVKTDKMIRRNIKGGKNRKGAKLYRLMISTTFQNLINFSNYCKINYCSYKKKKLTNTINEFKLLKKHKYDKLITKGYGAEHAMNLLNLTPNALYEILNDTEFIVKEKEAVYT